MLARWFLLYKPSGVVPWMLHLLFYAYMAFIVIGLIGIFSPWDKDSPGALGAAAVFLIPAYFLVVLTHYLERRRLLRAASA